MAITLIRGMAGRNFISYASITWIRFYGSVALPRNTLSLVFHWKTFGSPTTNKS